MNSPNLMKKILVLIALFLSGLLMLLLLLTPYLRIKEFAGYPGSHFPFYTSFMAIEQKALYSDFFSTSKYIDNANILIIGNSRTQTAFIPDMMDTFFNSLGLRYYMLACGHAERFQFFMKLIEHYDIRDKTVVVNIESFFHASMSEPATEAVNLPVSFLWFDIAALYHYDAFISKFVRNMPFYRSIERGTWYLESRAGIDWSASPAVYRKYGTLSDDYVHNMEIFIRFLRDRDFRIVFMVVPTEKPDTSIGSAKSLSIGYNIPLILVDSTGFMTYDKSHLNRAAAINFSTQFFKKLSPLLRKSPKF